MRIGFFGLGVMGTPMVFHLVNAGHTLFVHTVGALPEVIRASCAVLQANENDVTRAADAVFLTILKKSPAHSHHQCR